MAKTCGGAIRATVADLFVELDRRSHEPLQLQLVRGLRELIDSGHLQPGTRLPGSRELAKLLGVSRNTVVQAYDRLAAEGYLEQRAASGTFVSPRLSASAARASMWPERAAAGVPRPQALRVRAQQLVDPHDGSPANFWLGRLPAEAFPGKSWLRAYARGVARGAGLVTRYTDPAGLADLRCCLAERLRLTRGVEVRPEQVVVCGGSQEALNLVARLLVREGTPILLEDPCYAGAASVFASYGAALQPVPVDRHGLATHMLPGRGAAAIYVTPSHQYPMGFVMPPERRFELLAWARRTGCYVVEDDYDSDFRYDGPPLMALKGHDGDGLVLYIGTFSKALGPGLRLGYLVVPTELVGPLRELKALFDYGRSRLEQFALAQVLRCGAFDRHLRRMHRLYRRRRDRLLDGLRRIFGPLRVSGTEGGLHFALHLPEASPAAADWAGAALAEGVVLVDFARGAVHDAGTTGFAARTLLFGYAAADDRAIDTALAVLARLATCRSHRVAAGR